MKEIRQIQNETVPVVKKIDIVEIQQSTMECGSNRGSGNGDTSDSSDVFKSDFL